MMSLSPQQIRVGAVASAVTGLVAAPLSLLGAPAQASTACATSTPAATLVGGNICEVIMTDDGTFTAPSGVSKIQALVVGAGGGGAYSSPGARYSYGGGGGEVIMVSDVSSGNHTVTVGSGGAPGTDVSGTDGGDTDLDQTSALGGGGAYPSGPSGSSPRTASNGTSIWTAPTDCGDGQTTNAFGEGSGAGGVSVQGNTAGGAGVTAGSLTGADSTLWPALVGEPEYGPGGSVCITNVTQDVPGAGGSTNALGPSAGHDGAVIFRWAANQLPDTGASVQPWMMGVGAATVVGGAVLASGLFRVRRRGRHSA